MANIIDYLVWRGDLPLSDYPFNEVDNLILSEIAYLDWDGIVPPPGRGSIRFREAAERFFEIHPIHETSLGLLIPKSILDLTLAASMTPRFADIHLSGYVNEIDNDLPTQFSALTAENIADSYAVVFRGTDDTLAGWQEDFNMSFMQTVPAQEKALDYLREQICRRVQEKLIVCGHSKGGNLAVYSAANCSEWMQDRITAVYNNDGPGFLFKPGSADGYRRIADRIHLILPENSLVGILLEQVGNYKVVSSSAAGANQHDGMTWQVYGTEFPAVKSLTSSSFKTRQTLHSRLYAMNENQRRGLISGLFDVARKAQTFTLTDMYANRGKITRILMDRLKNMDAVQKDEMLRLVRLLVMGQGVENGRSLSVRTHKSSENP